MTATITNLKTQIQNRINSANSSTTLDQLLELRVAATGLGCDESNLDTLMSAINAGLDSQDTNEDLIIARAASGVNQGAKTVVKKSQAITSSGDFTVSTNLAGNTIWATGCGGGGSGCVATVGSGGFGGAYGIRIPLQVTAGQVISAVIGAGALGVANSLGNVGGQTTFGSLTFAGGSGGRSMASNFSSNSSAAEGFGVRPFLTGSSSATVGYANPSEKINGFIAGANNISSSEIASGGAAGLFGNGTAAAATVSTANAGANTGAGSGALRTSGTTGNGGSGKIVVEWEEFI